MNKKLFKTEFRHVTISFIYNKSVQTQNLSFLSYWYRKKRLQMHFFLNRYSGITQFTKLAAGEQSCRLCCTHKKLQHFKIFKSFSRKRKKNHRFWDFDANERYYL